ncbi:MAG: PQQ-binding-like beta-propeller repeat protein [Verrucomicrobiia bacterium]
MKSMMKYALVLNLAATLTAFSADTNWEQFRGPYGNGITQNKNLPIKWSEKTNVVWKTPIHGKGWSSPVVYNDQIWITTGTEAAHKLYAICVDAKSGKIIYDLNLFNVEKPQFIHQFNSPASPTPVIEKGRVYITFGSPGTACIDTSNGKVLWERRDFVCNHYRGAASSPIIYNDLLILHFDGSDYQYIVALNKNTGETVWKKDRSIDFKDLDANGKPVSEGDLRKAFSTPHIAIVEGKPILLSQGSKAIYAYDPLTGDEIWRVEERLNHSASNRPLFENGVVYCQTGWASGQILAFVPGEKGEVVDANKPPGDPSNNGKKLKILWSAKRNVPKKPGMILFNNMLFTIDDSGIATCYDAKTGNEYWRERIGGNYSASPLCADGRIYFFSEEGKTTVIEATNKFNILAVNQLDSGFMASPAVTGKALILRTKTHLYRIEEN